MTKYIGYLPAQEIVQYSGSKWDYVNTGDPAADTNPSKIGVTWLNLTTGEEFLCIDNTTDANIWYTPTRPVHQAPVTPTDPVLTINALDGECYDGSSASAYEKPVSGGSEWTLVDTNWFPYEGFFFSDLTTARLTALAGSELATADASNSWTCISWVKPTDVMASYSQSTSGTGALSGIKAWITGASQINIDNRAGSGVAVGTNGVACVEHNASHMPCPLWKATTIPSDSYTQVVVVCEQRVYKLYLGQTLVHTGLTSIKDPTIQRGSIAGGSYGDYTGYIAEVSIYDYALTTQQMTDNYNLRNSLFNS